MRKIPRIIYLQIKDEDGEILDSRDGKVTWCEDKINENDVKYKRVREKK